MCPDKQILSAYYDGELDDRWKLTVEAHIAECDHCRREIENFSSVRDALLEDREIDIPVRQAGAWRLLRKRLAYALPLPVWRRRFQVPVPVFAVMALAVAALAVGLILTIDTDRGYQPFDNVTEANLASHELKSIDDILNYLDARGDGFSVTIELPQDTRFRISSEPALMRAADYNRSR